MTCGACGRNCGCPIVTTTGLPLVNQNALNGVVLQPLVVNNAAAAAMPTITITTFPR